MSPQTIDAAADAGRAAAAARHHFSPGVPCAADRGPRPSDSCGVRAINALLTVGRGQRLGLFAGSGVGKSVLLGMMARYTAADVIVVGLIGERGREVKEFIEQILGEEGRARSVVVAAPADARRCCACRARLCHRDRRILPRPGQHVLLIMDSLTRYAMAQREIALAIGEPPATKGYPPSVLRHGHCRTGGTRRQRARWPTAAGSITAGSTRCWHRGRRPAGSDRRRAARIAILDGHIVLSARVLADR
jgi:flagellum-specific ATP synthase